ncbi:hypothetical protein ACTMTJ_08600 [Phytohabitans sp. LJ34]|uniref:hypothetical protein n=1 Tax=Phytohabitans sp. LJ34 TaxID=3452217 RepID=UPI003F8CC26F
MRAGRANRLARRAGRRRPDGTLTWRARRAWERLADASQSRDDFSAAALHEAWLADPREDTWGYVGRWCTPADMFAATVDPDRGAESRAAIGGYCVEHDLVPDNPVERALFFVLTGQHERHQALDLDGTLLAAVYRGATEATREVLRETMVELGELNLVRVIADRPDRVLTGAEADYLARQVADAGDWERLWRLVPVMPLASAVRTARLFPHWRPDDGVGRDFFARLAGTSPDAIIALGQAAVTSLKPWYHRRDRWKGAPSFAPDNSEIAVRGTLFTLPRGHVVASYETRTQELALGNATIVHVAYVRPYGPTVIRNAPGRAPETLLRGLNSLHIGSTRGGFVVGAQDKLWFGSATRSWSRVARVEWPADVATSEKTLLAADPGSGNLAFHVGNGDEGDDGYTEGLALVDASGQLLARAKLDDDFGHVHAFYGPDQVLVESLGSRLSLWRRDGSDLVQAAAAEIDASVVAPVPARNLLVVRREGKPELELLTEASRLAWLDASTLVEVDPPAGFPVLDGRLASFSPDGSLVAVQVENSIEVHDLALHQLADLAAGSLSQGRVADLEAAAELRKRKVAPHLSPAVELLHAGLAYRFATDIALGAGTRIAGGASDIALGGQ